VQIGIRGALFSADEHRWAEENGITIIRMEQVNELGVERVMQRAREIVGDQPYLHQL
jgi:guanidinopropionase